GIEIALRQRLEFRLIMHILPTTGQNKQCSHRKCVSEGPHQLGTSDKERGFRLSRNRRVSARSYFASEAKMIRKNRSLLAKANRSTLNTGWYGIGKPLSANIPNTAAMPANRIVISNVTTMNAGQECSGFPPTLIGYASTAIQYCMRYPLRPPRIPPISTTSGTPFLWNPMASASSSTGKGL